MGCLLRLITVMLLTAGACLWLVFLGQVYEKLVHPEQKNFNSGEFFWLGLGLFFLTAITYLGFRAKRAARSAKDA